MSFGTLRYKDRSITLWPERAKDEAEASCAAMENIVDAAVERVEAEMPDTGLVCSFVAFDLHAWARIRRGKRDHRARAVETQKTRALRLVRAFPAIADVDGTADALCALAETLSASLPAASGHEDGRYSDDDAKRIDNRRLWGHALYHDRCSGELPKLVHWYVSILDNTGVVRGLSRHHCCWLDCCFSEGIIAPLPPALLAHLGLDIAQSKSRTVPATSYFTLGALHETSNRKHSPHRQQSLETQRFPLCFECVCAWTIT